MSSDSDSDVAPIDAQDKSTPSAQPQRKRRRRPRSTYHVRKDEIHELQARMQELELELKALKFQALVRNGSSSGDSATDTSSVSSPAPSSSSSSSASAASPALSSASSVSSLSSPLPLSHTTGPVASPTPSTAAKSLFTHHLLKDALKTQQFALAGLQALVSKYASLQDVSPLHLSIHLPSDVGARRAALIATRHQALGAAKRFIADRSAGLDPLRAFAEQERYESLHGTFCVLNFDVLPLPPSPARVFSAQNALEAFSYLVRNVEITFSEWVGHITVRENDESPDAQCSQHRLVATCSSFHGQVETNVVTYYEYNEDEGLGIFLVESVETDELYPYQPLTRMRRDTSGVFTFRQHGDTVVVTRWSLSKIHPSRLLHNREAERGVRASLGIWGDKLLDEVYRAAERAAAVVSDPSASVVATAVAL